MSSRHTASFIAMLALFALALVFFALAATSVMAQAPFACRLGEQAKDSHLIAERFERVLREDMEGPGRNEYWVTVRNPHPWPAAVLAGIQMRGIAEAPAVPEMVPPRETARVLIGWFPLDMSLARMAPPELAEVIPEVTFPFCLVMQPQPQPRLQARPSLHSALRTSAPGAVAPGGFQVIRDEGAHDIHQGF